MRHRNKTNSLGRTSDHRKAMLSNMASSLIIHKRIKTTVAKAKALRVYVEPLITRSKEDTTHSRRVVFSHLQNKEAVTELFREVSQKIADRPGGYTRILKLGNRPGDAAEICYIELVDYNEAMLEATKASSTEAKKTTRRSRSRRKTTAETEIQETVETVAEEEVTEKQETVETEKPVAEKEEAKAEVETVESKEEVAEAEKSTDDSEEKAEEKSEDKKEEKSE